MAFARPTLADLVDRISTDITTRLTLTGASLRRSVVAILARALAGAAHGLHGHIEWASLQLFPDTADAEFLDRHASLHGLTRIAATTAAGNITLTGSNGSVAAAGTVLQRSDGVTYTTQASATIGSGTATVAVEADIAGANGNADVGVTLAFVSPVAGINATATIASGGIADGADAESDSSLRARLLTQLRTPPQGGSSSDYVAWALAVAGVTRAWAYPLQLGAGTVVVMFVRDGDGTGSAIIPDSGEVATVQSYINARRPVTASVTVAAPTAVSLNLTVHIAPDTTVTRAAVTAELQDLLARVAAPGLTLLRSQIAVAIGAAEGVDDFLITLPAADVTYTTGQIPVLGTVTWA